MKKFPLFIFTLILLVPTIFVHAAKVSFEQPSDIVQAGDVVTILLQIDTEGKTLNAFAGEIKYSEETLEVAEILDGDSIVNFWVENPGVKDDMVVFSGITPGGVTGRELNLLAIKFTVIKEGVGEVALAQSEFLVHDGLGTPETVSSVDLAFNILGALSAPAATTEYVDTEPPEPFAPVVVQDKDVFEGDPFLVFSTEDKGSGIAFYEVKEGTFAYEAATSPYRIKNPQLKEALFVRAVDHDGNEYIAEVYPQSAKHWRDAVTTKAVILIVCMLALLFVVTRVFGRRSLHS
jgi:hypothetical protein